VQALTMKKNLVPLLGIAFVVAIATTGIFYGLFEGKLGASAPVSVVVAAKDLKPGTTLSPELVKVTSWSGSSLPGGSFTSADQLIGRTLTKAVGEGDPVLTANLERLNAGSGAVPPNQRAVSTHVTDSLGIIEMLHPGDHVDVHLLNAKDHGEPEIRMILQNRIVLAVHAAPDPTSFGAAAAPVVTLLVDKNEAESLALADSTARVRLALRNPADNNLNPHAGIGFTTRRGCGSDSGGTRSGKSHLRQDWSSGASFRLSRERRPAASAGSGRHTGCSRRVVPASRFVRPA
jgi:pilus assembly protein CpaB